MDYLKTKVPLILFLIFSVLYVQSCNSSNEQKAKELNDQGIVYAKTGNTAKAVEKYQEAIKICPEYPEPYKNLSKIYEVLGMEEQALIYKFKGSGRAAEKKLKELRSGR